MRCVVVADVHVMRSWRFRWRFIHRRSVRLLTALAETVDTICPPPGIALDALEAHGLKDDTLVVFTADHGGKYPL